MGRPTEIGVQLGQGLLSLQQVECFYFFWLRKYKRCLYKISHNRKTTVINPKSYVRFEKTTKATHIVNLQSIIR